MDDRPRTRDRKPEAPSRDTWRITSDASGTPAAPQALAPSPAQAPPRRDDPSAHRDADREVPRRSRLAQFARSMLTTLATLVVLGLAALAALVIWDYYVTAPWTRDGRVRVQVASVAPQVSGQITEIRVVDNQFVHKGDVLYIMDPFDFKIALDQAKTQVKMKAADLQVKSVEAQRRQNLTTLSTSIEEKQQYVGNAAQAEAAFQAAQAQEAQAEINLKRTAVLSPVNGFITNLLMRVGDYARAGTPNISVIDADSYWVDGYFEETKMAHVCVGDRAEAKLMGYSTPILGRIESVTRGISVSDAAAGTQGLPNVDAVYTWVRLAQRVPVRMRITDVPPGVPLVSGMTATVTVHDPALDAEGSWWQQRFDGLRTRIAEVFNHPTPRPDCVPPVGFENGRTVTLPTPEPKAPLAPNEINPGLTPGMAVPPEPR